MTSPSDGGERGSLGPTEPSGEAEAGSKSGDTEHSQEALIRECERLLHLAKSGELTGLGFAMVLAGRAVGVGLITSDSVLLLSAVSMLFYTATRSLGPTVEADTQRRETP